MPPTLYLIRHAQAIHNVDDVTDEETFDAPLTKYGEDSTDLIREEFRRNVDEPIDLVVASPHRRSIQTAVLGFAGVLDNEGVKLHLLPAAQGVSKRLSNEGFPRQKLEIEVPRLFEGNELASKASQSVIYDDVVEGWNSKSGEWGHTVPEVEARAAKLRLWFYNRPEERIVVVSHRTFLHYLIEDWTTGDGTVKRGDGGYYPPPKNDYWSSCETREFVFSADSNEKEAHLIAKVGSKVSNIIKSPIEQDRQPADEKPAYEKFADEKLADGYLVELPASKFDVEVTEFTSPIQDIVFAEKNAPHPSAEKEKPAEEEAGEESMDEESMDEESAGKSPESPSLTDTEGTEPDTPETIFDEPEAPIVGSVVEELEGPMWAIIQDRVTLLDAKVAALEENVKALQAGHGPQVLPSTEETYPVNAPVLLFHFQRATGASRIVCRVVQKTAKGYQLNTQFGVLYGRYPHEQLSAFEDYLGAPPGLNKIHRLTITEAKKAKKLNIHEVLALTNRCYEDALKRLDKKRKRSNNGHEEEV